MARVFISYAREDLTVASEAHRWLVEAGHEAFLDQDPRDGITVGEQWEQRLHEQRNRTDAMVCVVTTPYLASTWCTAEVSIARSRGKRVLPLRAEPDVTHPLLSSTQHTDLAQGPAQAQAALVEALQRLDDAWPADRSPFPGLRPFDVEWQRVFFGRADEVRQLAGLLRSPAQTAALLVVGPSGCGKSSLVRAGLVPMMGEEPGWATLPPLVPGNDPVAALVRELATAARHSDLDWSVAHVRNQLNQGDLAGLADELLLAAPGGPRRRLLVVVDQFEELLTQTSQAERARFAELLRPAMSGPVQVVGTLRPEFLDQLLLDRHLSALPTQSFMLRPLRREALRAVIEQPAKLAGIELDDGLVDRLVEDTDSGEALPLLAFILAQLADSISRGGRISTARYDQLGGVQGGLSSQADQALADAVAVAGRSHEQVISGLLRLVTVDEHGRPTRWRIHRDELPKHVVAELNTFVARRLLTTDTDNDTVTIGVAHEAFLSAWPPLASAITANASALRARRTIEHSAAEWHDNSRPRERLWSGGQLAAAVTDIAARIDTDSRARLLPWRHGVLVTDRVDLSPTAGEFLHISIRRDRFRRRRTVTVLSVLLAVALIGATVAIIERGAAREQLHLATSRQLLAQAEVLLDSDPHTALRLGVAAARVDPSGESRGSLFNLLTGTLYAGSLTPDTDSVSSVAFSPVGNILATANRDGTVSRWDVTDPTRPRQLGQSLDANAASPIVFSPKEPILVTDDRGGRIKLWDLADPTMPRQLGQSLDADVESSFISGSVIFSPQGQVLATVSRGTVSLWDLADPATPRQLGQPLDVNTAYGSSVVFSPQGQTLAIADRDGRVKLWDVTDPATPRQVGQPLDVTTGLGSSVVFSPQGQILAIAGGDGTVSLWDVTDPATPRQLGQPLAANTSQLPSVVFSPQGQILAIAGGDGTVSLWDVTDPATPRRLDHHLAAAHPTSSTTFTSEGNGGVHAGGAGSGGVSIVAEGQALSISGGVSGMAFSADGQILATNSSDGTVSLWDFTDPTLSRHVGQLLNAGANWVASADLAAERQTVATASRDGTVSLWDITDPAAPRRLMDYRTAHHVALTPDGRTLATAANQPKPNAPNQANHNEAMILLWDITDPASPRQLGPPLPTPPDWVSAMAFTHDGNTLTVASNDDGNGVILLWDITNRAAPDQLGPPLTAPTAWISSMALTSDGHILAAASRDGTVSLWDITDPAAPDQLGPPLATAGPIFSVAFTADERTLATGSANGTVNLWDITNPAAPRQLGPPLTGPSVSITSVMFAHDKDTLVTVSADASVISWDLNRLNRLRDHEIKNACIITGGGLDRDEWERYVPEGLSYRDTCANS